MAEMNTAWIRLAINTADEELRLKDNPGKSLLNAAVRAEKGANA